MFFDVIKVLPGGSTENNTAMLLMSNLLSLPENQYFHCTADNGIPHPAQVRVLVEDLLYPNGSKFFHAAVIYNSNNQKLFFCYLISKC